MMSRHTVPRTPPGKSQGFRALSKTELALRDTEERFRSLADNIPQLAWMADEQGRVFWCNQRWLDYAGFEPSRINGNQWREIIHPEHFERVATTYQHSIATGEVWQDTFLMRRRDGQYRWFLARALPNRDTRGRVVRWLGTNTDITEQREAEEQLREADERRDEYLAMLGHELRNPLAGIVAATQLAKLTRPPDPRLQQAIDVLERQSNHVARIVDGLLEYSRLARGKIHIDYRALDLRQVLQEVIHDRQPQIIKRNLHLKQEMPSSPVMVNGDALRLVQIFDNLIGNAIKFTQSDGSITVRVRAEADEVIVTIADTGVGVHAEKLPRLFSPFYQEMDDAARATGGLGLGLSLVKSLVELHGGRVQAHSEGPGRGAEFRVSLPPAHVEVEARPAPVGKAQQQSRVLIVEDNVDAAATLAILLELKGHGVRIAHRAADALTLLETEEVDVVLCDIGLPGMSGYDFVRTLRSDPKLRTLPVIATTGYGQPEDRQRSMEAGFDEHITKPISIELLEKYLRPSSQTKH